MRAHWLVFPALLFAILPVWAGRIVFNDPYPETHALEIWQLTDDPITKQHSMYHNVTPFSPDGHYCLYQIVRMGQAPGGPPPTRTFGVYDLHEDREIYVQPTRAYFPLWGNVRNAIYFVDDTREEDATLFRLEVPSFRLVPLHTGPKSYIPAINCDDRYLFGAEDGKLYRYENRERGEKKLIYTPPGWPAVKVSIPKGSPTKPWILCRQNSNRPESPVGTHARIIVDVEGKLVNPALGQDEHCHADWHASGEAVLRGDGPLRVRRVMDPWPGDWFSLGPARGGDPARQGASGRWATTNQFSNGTITLVDARSGRSWPIVHTVSHIHQPASDTADRSGPYDSDQHGSPDGTKMYFSTNYDIHHYPVAVVTERGRDDATEPITVNSTKGFPGSGLLSYFGEVTRYGSKTDTQFRDLTRGYYETRPRSLLAGWPICNYLGRADEADEDPLSHQHHTDAYIAVVRLPDRPTLLKDREEWVLYPGRNHRETGALVLYRDGKRERELASGAGDTELDLPGGTWTATAVEWSGLESDQSRAALQGPARLRVRWDRPASLDEPQVRYRVGDREVAAPPMAGDYVVVYAGEDGDYRWDTVRNGEVVERRWATPGYAVTLIETFREGVRAERKFLDNASENPELIETFDPTTGRLVKVRKRSWDGWAWDVLTYDNGRFVERVKTDFKTFESHYLFNVETRRLEQVEGYRFENGKKVKVFPPD